MSFVIVLLGIILLLLLIAVKLNPVLALLISSVFIGLLLQMPITGIMDSIGKGIGSTMGGLIMVLALGAMFGKILEDSGVAQRIVSVLVMRFKKKNIQWAVLLTGILVGIPLFYNAGFVVLIPLIFVIASSTQLPLLYVGIPMAASLSITHGFLPPHPGPLALASILNADVGRILIYGLILSMPVAVVAGIIFPRLIIRPEKTPAAEPPLVPEEANLPHAGKSFIIALLPVVLIATGTAGTSFFATTGNTVFHFLQDPTIALLFSVLAAVFLLGVPMGPAMAMCTDGVKSIAMIIMIIAAGGGFKQILIDSGIGQQIAAQANFINLSPLFLGWLITALLRIAIGSATVAALTASGIVLPLLETGISPELMVLAVGAGSLMGSHVNDTGFWMFKEYFQLSMKQTLATWTVMESLISVLGLLGVLLLHYLGLGV